MDKRKQPVTIFDINQEYLYLINFGWSIYIQCLMLHSVSRGGLLFMGNPHNYNILLNDLFQIYNFLLY
jgi:hypothetical protein